MWSLSHKYLNVLCSPLWWCETIKCLLDEMKWSEWYRHCEVALGYYSIDLLTVGQQEEYLLRVILDPGAMTMMLDVRSGPSGWWGFRAGWTRMALKCHHTNQNGAHNLKLLNCLFLEFLLKYFCEKTVFWPQLTETVESGTADKGRLLYSHSVHDRGLC